ncbi:hypothetical protein K523DRAFT_422161 [Schizophyllum commune Tattone D]|nr:hypothetical protein K523DRAFT_422161 [Schizophyllum commune Tattone D]
MTSRLNVLASTAIAREGDADLQKALSANNPASLDPTSTSSSRPSPPPEPSMSTAFPDTPVAAFYATPLAANPTTPPPDAVLISRDNVHFFVKGIRLFPAFRNLLPARGPRVYGLLFARGPLVAGLPFGRGPSVVGLPSARDPSVAGPPPARGLPVAGLPSALAADTAETLNIILHAALNRELVGFAPSVSAIGAAVDRFNAYGLDASVLLAPGRPLHRLLASQIPTAPLAVYVVAARADARALAAAASAHLLDKPVHEISDEGAEAMGAVYLKRLFMLHRRRVDALKELLGRAPGMHAEGDGEICEERGVLAKRWDNVTVEIVVNAKPNTPASHIESTLSSIARHLSCERCKTSLQERTQECVADWSAVARTI